MKATVAHRYRRTCTSSTKSAFTSAIGPMGALASRQGLGETTMPAIFFRIVTSRTARILGIGWLQCFQATLTQAAAFAHSVSLSSHLTTRQLSIPTAASHSTQFQKNSNGHTGI